jgi:hypothetical protein
MGRHEMDQLGNYAGPAKQVASLAHENVTGLGLEPVPTFVLLSIVVLVGLVALVVRGGNNPSRGAHRA